MCATDATNERAADAARLAQGLRPELVRNLAPNDL